MKFLMVIQGSEIPEHIKNCLAEQPARSGMYNWLFVHKGIILPWNQAKGVLDEYDVVQVNLSPVDMPLVENLLELKKPHTKLVVNNDYVCEKWVNWGIDPWYYDNIQKKADMVFGTEYHQVSNMIEGTHIIPHPTNTKILKHLGVDPLSKEDSIGYIYHWWDGEVYIPSRILRYAKEKFGIKYSRAFGFSPTPGHPMQKWHKIMFDKITPIVNFPDYIDMAQKCKVLYDPNSCHTYGRNAVEAACLGIPFVGSNRVFSNNLLFPELVCDPYDFHETMKRFEIVFKQPKKLKKIMKYAYDKVEYFNYDNSRERYLEALK